MRNTTNTPGKTVCGSLLQTRTSLTYTHSTTSHQRTSSQTNQPLDTNDIILHNITKNGWLHTHTSAAIGRLCVAEEFCLMTWLSIISGSRLWGILACMLQLLRLAGSAILNYGISKPFLRLCEPRFLEEKYNFLIVTRLTANKYMIIRKLSAWNHDIAVFNRFWGSRLNVNHEGRKKKKWNKVNNQCRKLGGGGERGSGKLMSRPSRILPCAHIERKKNRIKYVN